LLIFLAAFVVLTGLVALLGLSPDVRMGLGVQDPQRPFSARFNVENDSVFSIRDVSVDCQVHRAQIGQLAIDNPDVKATEQTRLSEIDGRSRAAVQCGIFGGISVQSADMTIELSYRYLFKRHRTSTDFVLLNSGNWIPRLPPQKHE